MMMGGKGRFPFELQSARCENLLAFDLSVIPCQIDWKTGKVATTWKRYELKVLARSPGTTSTAAE